jgi:5-(carboxyamino)imidazole ribonucleotide mutase
LQLHHFLISVLIAHATHDLISLSHMSNTAIVGIIMGSTSDWPTMEHAAKTLEDFGVAWEAQVVSAHRTPQKLYDFASSAKDRGLKVIIAGAGGAAHLPGMCAAMTPLPVLGVPVESKTLKGIDSLLSIVQMPAGIPTATFAIGKAGAINAALFAIAQLATTDIVLAEKLNAFRSKQTQTVLDADLPPLA